MFLVRCALARDVMKLHAIAGTTSVVAASVAASGFAGPAMLARLPLKAWRVPCVPRPWLRGVLPAIAQPSSMPACASLVTGRPLVPARYASLRLEIVIRAGALAVLSPASGGCLLVMLAGSGAKQVRISVRRAGELKGGYVLCAVK